jgi:hypothetical protein
MIKRPTTFAHVLLIFLLALGVRLLTWQDNRRDIGRVQTSVTAGYKESANQLLSGDFRSFIGDVNHLGHPPGYPIIIAAVTKVFGSSDSALQFLQMVCDSFAVVLLYLIALQLLSVPVALVSGLLAALSPQFAYFSVLLLPDSLIVLPLLGSIFFLIRARKGSSLNFVIAGCLIGISCWSRANALFLVPFIALCTPLFVMKGRRLRAGLLLIAGAVVVISPITIKNALVYRAFVPVSLGAGQTLLEGIADYDDKGAFNIPQTDLGIMKQEAEWYDRPDYAQWLFGVDGVERDRKRVTRGLSVIASHPLWFSGVMVKRGVASTRLDPVPVLLPESPVSSDLNSTKQLTPVSQISFSDLARTSTLAPGVSITDVLKGNSENYADQLVSQPISVRPGHDYALTVDARLSSGRVLLKITDPQQKPLASMVVELSEVYPADQQPVQEVIIPFVSARNSQVHFAVANSAATNSAVTLGTVQLFELQPSSGRWLRYLRMPLGAIQKIFKTDIMVPLAIIGLLILFARRQFLTATFLLLIPAYYLVVQSTLHTERRYVYVIHFFFTVFASIALCWLSTRVYQLFTQRPQ